MKRKLLKKHFRHGEAFVGPDWVGSGCWAIKAARLTNGALAQSPEALIAAFGLAPELVKEGPKDPWKLAGCPDDIALELPAWIPTPVLVETAPGVGRVYVPLLVPEPDEGDSKGDGAEKDKAEEDKALVLDRDLAEFLFGCGECVYGRGIDEPVFDRSGSAVLMPIMANRLPPLVDRACKALLAVSS